MKSSTPIQRTAQRNLSATSRVAMRLITYETRTNYKVFLANGQTAERLSQAITNTTTALCG